MAELKKQCELAELKQMLSKYDLRQLSVGDTECAEVSKYDLRQLSVGDTDCASLYVHQCLCTRCGIGITLEYCCVLDAFADTALRLVTCCRHCCTTS